MILPKKGNICIGTISGPHGVRGALKIRMYLDDPGDIAQYTPICFQNGSVFSLKKVIQVLPSSVIVSVHNLNDRDAALALRGENLYIARDQLPEIDDKTYYHTDLIGLSVQNEAGKIVGKVKYVHDYGAGPLLEIFEEKTAKSILVPFQDVSVPEVNLDKGIILVLDVYLQDLYQE
jgi:16S rRNA processing protein RimM